MLDVLNLLSEMSVLAARPPRSKAGARPNASDEKNTSAGAPRLLIVGSIRELGLYRAEYLRNKGFLVQVSAPPSASEIVATLKQGGFNAVILSYTLPNQLALDLSDLVRQHCPQCALIAISNDHGVDPRIMPDELVIADHGPEALLKAIRRALGERIQ